MVLLRSSSFVLIVLVLVLEGRNGRGVKMIVAMIIPNKLRQSCEGVRRGNLGTLSD